MFSSDKPGLNLKSIVITPKVKDSLALRDREIPVPGRNQVLLRVLKVGICGTDRDIISGFYGEPPEGSTDLILSHESLCRISFLG